MASGERKNTANRKNNRPGTSALTAGEGLLPSVPGLLVCVPIAAMTILDLLPVGMAEKQYTVFPALFLAVNVIAGVCGACFILPWVRRRRLRVNSTMLLFSAFAVLILISTLINGLTREAIHGIPYRHIGIFGMFLFLAVYCGVTSQISAEAMRERILFVFMAAADLAGITALFDRYVIEIPAYHAKKELSAVFFNGNHYGYFLLMAVLTGLGLYMYCGGRKQYFGIVTMILNAFLLILNHSMGCILALLAVLAGLTVSVLVSDRDRRKRAGILCCAALACLAAAVILSPDVRDEFVSLGNDVSGLLKHTSDGSEGHNRLILWSLTWEYIREHPVFGTGCEAIAFRLFEVTGRSNPHNELLTYAAYYGIPAAICYTAGVISVFVRYFRHRTEATAAVKTAVLAAAGYFISSLFGVAMFYTTPLFFVLLGTASCTDGNGHDEQAV